MVFSKFVRIIFINHYYYSKDLLWHPELVRIAIISIQLASIIKILSLARHLNGGIVLIVERKSLLITIAECF